MATNWVDEVKTGATSTGSKTLSLATGSALSVANTSSENIFTVTSDTTNGGYTSVLGIENQESILFLGADNADDAGDVWQIQADTSGNLKIGNRTVGTGAPTRGNTIVDSITIDSSRNISVGVNDTGYDVKFFGATSGSYLLWDESQDTLKVKSSTLHVNCGDILIDDDTGSTELGVGLQYGSNSVAWVSASGNSEISIGKLGGAGSYSGTTAVMTVNAATDATQLNSTLTVGVDDTGHDVKFFGATSGSFLLWDESDDALELTDSTPLKIGDGGDMQIYHDGSHSLITNSTGTMKLATENSGIAVSIGHGTSETTINDNLTVVGQFSCNGKTHAAPQDYTLTDMGTRVRALDYDTSTATTVRKCLATLIDDLINVGILQ